MMDSRCDFDFYTPYEDFDECASVISTPHLHWLDKSLYMTWHTPNELWNTTIYSYKRNYVGYHHALALYHDAVQRELQSRDEYTSTRSLCLDIDGIDVDLPIWWGVEEFHAGQRAAMATRYEVYRNSFPMTDINSPRWWMVGNEMHRDSPNSGVRAVVYDGELVMIGDVSNDGTQAR